MTSLQKFLFFAAWVAALPVLLLLALHTVLATIGFLQRWWPRYGRCRVCGCTDESCFDCIVATGEPCWWVDSSHTLCSRCVNALSSADCDDLSPDCSPLNARKVTSDL
jgi:hypothetical protein